MLFAVGRLILFFALLAFSWGLTEIIQQDNTPPKYWRMQIDSAVVKAERQTDAKFMIREYLQRMDSLKNEIKSER